jgi:hypothetical protein
VRRRWTVLVLLPTLLLCCGTVTATPLLWVARMTLDAGRGAPGPDAAADTYLTALSYGDDEGLLPLLDDDHQDDLLKQWRTYRDAMQHTDPPPARLDYGALTVGPIVDGWRVSAVEVPAWCGGYVRAEACAER